MTVFGTPDMPAAVQSVLQSIYIPENKGSLRCVLSNLLDSSKRKII